LKAIDHKLSSILCVALVIGTIALYCPLLWHGFINYDDPDYILNNPHVNTGLTWPNIVWALKSSYAANWHPLTWISHMLDCQLFGLNASGHHLVNVFFHTANAALLFNLLRRMTGSVWRSFFVAALFAWHPLHVESVAWASERKDVLSAFFWMLTLICYGRYAKSMSFKEPHVPALASSLTPDGMEQNQCKMKPRAFRASFYLLALFFFACGLMSKPMVVTLPCVLMLLDFWPLKRFKGTKGLTALIVEKIPFFALAAGSCLITMSVQRHAMWSSASLPLPFRLANALMSYIRYISKIFVPTDLALIYPYPHSWPIVGVVAAGLVLSALTIVFIFQARRFPYLVVGWFWYLGTLVPAIGLVQAGVQSMADRYSYLPSIGIFILTTWGVTDLLTSRPRRAEVCAFVGALGLGTCVVLTSIQLTYWRSSLAMFTHTVLVTTDNYAADDCLGKVLQDMGDKVDAEKLFEQAVSLEPTYPAAQFDLGMNLLRLGDPVEAGQHLATAVGLYPSDPVMQYDYGVFLMQHGHNPDAAAHLKAALALNPDFTQARKQLEAISASAR
jgi:hypothetical protein